MWYTELRQKQKYVLGLPGGTQIGLEHGKKPKDYEHQPVWLKSYFHCHVL